MRKHLGGRVFYRSTFVNPIEKQRMMLRSKNKKVIRGITNDKHIENL